jgi:hypothetical protein
VNRLACRVMVAVAGMAVLGMTATLAGAQTHPATYTRFKDLMRKMNFQRDARQALQN